MAEQSQFFPHNLKLKPLNALLHNFFLLLSFLHVSLKSGHACLDKSRQHFMQRLVIHLRLLRN